ncbi:hypothetical protein AB6A40_000302 [Gnathostoma spinigerum]|uniref:Uncharacterized protein n=1 Tax=Gnathostoma spinigerum TaxID=75299 RepID=A0ABD6E1X8_9BILA
MGGALVNGLMRSGGQPISNFAPLLTSSDGSCPEYLATVAYYRHETFKHECRPLMLRPGLNLTMKHLELVPA